jgi:hypothetical protein
MKKILQQLHRYIFVVFLLFVSTVLVSYAQEILGDTVEPEPQSVEVDWLTTSLQNTQQDNSGYWFYEIKSNGTVSRDLDEAVYLNLEKIDPANEISVFTLHEYESGTLDFFVSFPPCDDTGKNCDVVEQSPVEAGYTYQLYFSDVRGERGTIIDDDTNPIVALDAPPYQFDGDVVSGLSHELEDDSDRQWYRIEGTIAVDVPGSTFDIAIRDSNGEEASLGRVQANAGTRFSLPQINANNSVSLNPELNHTVLIRLEGKTVQTYAINGSGADSDDNSGSGGTGVVYNETQQDVINNGIVARNCGYNLAEGGRPCGFSDIIALIQRIIEYIFVLVLPIAAIVFAYVGWLYITSGGNSGKRDKAKAAMLNLLKGIILIMAAWLIVRTILVTLGAAPEIKQFLNIVD